MMKEEALYVIEEDEQEEINETREEPFQESNTESDKQESLLERLRKQLNLFQKRFNESNK